MKARSMTAPSLSRKTFLLGAAAAGLSLSGFPLHAAQKQSAIVHFDPLCGCCKAWVAHLEEAGFAVELRETDQLNRIKARLGVPDDLGSCHSAEIGGYVIEGHVPAGAIERLLAEAPDARGISVPGMPIGSPGMEVADMEDDVYEVILFGEGAHAVFARYRGGELLDA
jgi:hypothetical protein